MLFRCIFNTFCIVCYVIYFIYISHVALSYFAVSYSQHTYSARDCIFLPISSTSFCGCRIYCFFAYDRIRFHFLRELPCLSLDLLLVSYTFVFYLLPRRKRDITFSLLPTFDYWTVSRIESSLPRQVDYTLEVVMTIFSSLASIPHGTKRWI